MSGGKSALKAPLISGSTASSASDPFYSIRDALESQIRQLRVKFDQWKGLLQSSNTSTDITFRLKNDELQTDLKKTDDACKKIKLAVANIAKNRSKFAHVDDAELESRQAAIAELEKDLSVMKDYMNSKEAKSKLEGDQKRELSAKAAAEVATSIQGYNAYNASNSDYLRDQSQAQTQIRNEQNESVDKLSSGLSRVKELAVAIDAEVREQDAMLKDIDTEVDVAQNKMDSALSHIEKLLKTKDRCTLCTIFILVIAFVAVAITAFYVLTKT